MDDLKVSQRIQICFRQKKTVMGGLGAGGTHLEMRVLWSLLRNVLAGLENRIPTGQGLFQY